MPNDELFMQRCIELASIGLGHVAPNPLVGALLLCDDKIIGEGFHRKFGEAHAEVVAINHAIEKYGEDILKRSTLYVNLEPCIHFGKTPPCVDLIIEKKIPRVVVGATDPFEKVHGKGIRKLAEASVDVKAGVLEQASRALNKRFITFHESHRPYIILKYAQSEDGFVAHEKPSENNRWITNEYSRQLVHKWRSEEQAIMIGTNTAKIDDPALTVRDWHGKNPLRIVLDRTLQIPKTQKIFDQSAMTFVFNEIRNEISGNVELIEIDFKENVLEQILNALHLKKIQSVIVEGGAKLLQLFIDQQLWDEARIFTGLQFIGRGTKAPEITGNKISEENILNDKLITVLRQKDR
jgi:diaminohydroxyphosphoribosylaminopyrimidine deaminase/5-amino-6-(5-phosphoribosylamino)uracil reductase